MARGQSLNLSESAANPGLRGPAHAASESMPRPRARGQEECRSHSVVAAPARPTGRPYPPQRSGGQGAPSPRPDISREEHPALWPANNEKTPPAIGVPGAPAQTTVTGTERPAGRQSAGRCLRRSGSPGPPPGRQSQVPSGPMAGSRQDDASGNQGARAPRPDDSRRNRAAHWPAVGEVMPPAIEALRAPARTTAVRPRSPLAGKR